MCKGAAQAAASSGNSSSPCGMATFTSSSLWLCTHQIGPPGWLVRQTSSTALVSKEETFTDKPAGTLTPFCSGSDCCCHAHSLFLEPLKQGTVQQIPPKGGQDRDNECILVLLPVPHFERGQDSCPTRDGHYHCSLLQSQPPGQGSQNPGWRSAGSKMKLCHKRQHNAGSAGARCLLWQHLPASLCELPCTMASLACASACIALLCQSESCSRPRRQHAVQQHNQSGNQTTLQVQLITLQLQLLCQLAGCVLPPASPQHRLSAAGSAAEHCLIEVSCFYKGQPAPALPIKSTPD